MTLEKEKRKVETYRRQEAMMTHQRLQCELHCGRNE